MEGREIEFLVLPEVVEVILIVGKPDEAAFLGVEQVLLGLGWGEASGNPESAPVGRPVGKGNGMRILLAKEPVDLGPAEVEEYDLGSQVIGIRPRGATGADEVGKSFLAYGLYEEGRVHGERLFEPLEPVDEYYLLLAIYENPGNLHKCDTSDIVDIIIHLRIFFQLV